MINLEFTLEQHTPMLHFQPTQEGATLRATEVKPRFDRWLVRKVWGNGYAAFDLCKTYLVGYVPGDESAERALRERFNNGYRALNYKMRIVPHVDISNQVAMALRPAVHRHEPVLHKVLGVPMKTTANYPNNNQSVVMSNIGGRLEEDVVNFRLYDYVTVNMIVPDNGLAERLKANFETFIMETNFGNRKSKGFGSFVVSENNGTSISIEDIEQEKPRCFIYLGLDASETKSKCVNPELAYKDLFTIINKLWRKLKSNYRDRPGDTVSVLMNQHKRYLGAPPRVPSPIIFKPIIAKYKGEWQVMIAVIYDDELISRACINNAEDAFDGYLRALGNYLDQLDLDDFSRNLRLTYPLTELVLEF